MQIPKNNQLKPLGVWAPANTNVGSEHLVSGKVNPVLRWFDIDSHWVSFQPSEILCVEYMI